MMAYSDKHSTNIRSYWTTVWHQ